MKKDYQKDGICTANKVQEKECLNFKAYENTRYTDVCKFQGIGTVCNFEEKK